MKARPVALGLAALLTAAMPLTSKARSYGHYGHCTHFLHYDYSRSNALSLMSYIYPAANWGPFFQCHMYYAPAMVILPTPAPY